MLSSTASRCGHPPDVHATTFKPAPPSVLPLPHTGFVPSPTQHGLGRSGLKSTNDEMLIQAIISSISYRLEKLSLSDEPVLESAIPTISSPVYNVTPAVTGLTPSKNSSRPRLFITKSKLYEKLSNGFKAGLHRSLRKRGHTKKPQAPIPPPSVSQCSLADHQDYLIGRRVRAMGGLSVSDSIAVNPNSRDTKFEQFAFASRGTSTQQVRNPAFLQPSSSYSSRSTSSSAVWTPGDEATDDNMDEDEQRSPSARSSSPTPMDLEASTPSSNATQVLESPQAPFEAPALRDIHESVPEPTDEVMSDAEQGSSGSEVARQTEPTDTMMMDAASIETASSTLLGQEIDMSGAEETTRSSSLEPATTFSAQLTRDSPARSETSQLRTPETNPVPDPAPVNFANAAASETRPPSAQPLPTSGFYQTEEVRSVPSEPNATKRQVAISQSSDSTPVPTANATLASTVVDQAIVPPASAPTSTAGTSTPTPASPPRNPTQMPGPAPNGHASRVHQVLSKLRLSKRVPESTQPSVNDAAAEEAEAKVFFDNLFKRAPRPDLSKPQAKPVTPPPTSEPNKAKGSACRSLMDDIMAGFKKQSNSKSSSSREEITATTARSTVPSRSTATNASSTSPTIHPTHQLSLPPVAGRQPGPKPTLPSPVVKASRYVVASPSGRAPATVSATGKVPSSSSTILSTHQASLPVVAGRQTCSISPLPSSVVRTGRQVAARLLGRAPSTVSATDKVTGPSGSISAGAGMSSEAHQSSSSGMDGIESGRRPVKGSGRVARAIRKTGLIWHLVQQNVQRNQAALDTAQANAAASTTMSALERDVDSEERRSQEWHAAQPPPPPEAIPYITTGEEYQGDENDEAAMIDWILGRED